MLNLTAVANEDEQTSTLVRAAKVLGNVAGRIASAVGVEGTPAPTNLYSAEYLGSGTFIVHKPKRKNRKLRQSRLKGTVRGARK